MARRRRAVIGVWKSGNAPKLPARPRRPRTGTAFHPAPLPQVGRVAVDADEAAVERQAAGGEQAQRARQQVVLDGQHGRGERLRRVVRAAPWTAS